VRGRHYLPFPDQVNVFERKDKNMKNILKSALPSLLVVTLAVLAAMPVLAADKNSDEQTLRNAATVLQAMVGSKDVPGSVLAKADCIIILPSVKKFAVGIGGTGGRGPMSCREGKNFSGKWSAPAMYTIGGASAGFQIGGTATDFILLIMAPSAVDKVLTSKVKVGSDATAAAGPGATTSNSAGGADIFTYARAKGLFAGVSLDGSSLDPDGDANARLYGKNISAKEIVTTTTVKSTPAGQQLVTLLNSKIAKHTN
jgi:SH3 domain-containing YSC84-like protein 1